MIDLFPELYNVEFHCASPLTAKSTTPDVKWRPQYRLLTMIAALNKLYPEYTFVLTKNGATIRQNRHTILKISIGEGSRNNKAGGGKRGMTFEDELLASLTGESNLHSDLSDSVKTMLLSRGFDLSKTKFTKEGSRNQKRSFQFATGRIQFDRSGDIGDIITDISASDGSQSSHISLKYGHQYYLINLSLRQALKLDQPFIGSSDRNELLKYFGFRPTEFCEPYGLVSYDSGYESNDTVFSNWQKLIEDVVGEGYIYVIGGESESVLNFYNKPKIKIESISNPVYAIPGVRKYSKISIYCWIDDLYYRIDAQFRGTTSTDVYPIYMRLLATKLRDE